jgi:general secretion pathway protein J
MTAGRRFAVSGFTLVELLVAMTLLAGIMAALLTAMRSFAQVEERIDQRISRDEDYRSSMFFVRRILGEMAVRPGKFDLNAPKQVAFAGRSNEVDWIGVMPARHGAGGLTSFRLYVGQSEGANALLLDYAPLTNTDDPLASGPVETHVLATGVDGLMLRYRDTDDFDAQWFDEWIETERVPLYIGVQVISATLPWPELIVAVVPVAADRTPNRAGGGSGITTGPG